VPPENAFAFVYRAVPTGTSMLGISLQNDPTEATRAAALKRKNTPSRRQSCSHQANSKVVVGTLNSQKLNFLKIMHHHTIALSISDLLVITFCSFRIGFVWQRMWRKVGGQSVSVVEVLELEALMVQSHSMMFGAYNVQMK
jgi:hypothetical protein